MILVLSSIYPLKSTTIALATRQSTNLHFITIPLVIPHSSLSAVAQNTLKLSQCLLLQPVGYL